MRYTIFDQITEAVVDLGDKRMFSSDRSFDQFPYLTDIAPLARNDELRVYHGFRDMHHAVEAAANGISGAERVGRVYSYEADNNPKGLFVTLSPKEASQFRNAYTGGPVMQFLTKVTNLEAPVWPSGSYTVQGQYSQYFGHGHEGRRRRTQARRDQSKDLPDAAAIQKSYDPMLANTLFANKERQALFIGHLDPHEIECFWVEIANHQWKCYTPEQFIHQFGQAPGVKDTHRIFTANEEFDGDKWMAGLRKMSGDGLERTMQRLWNDIIETPRQNRVRQFLSYFEMFLWPKQVIPAMQWMVDRYGKPTAKK